MQLRDRADLTNGWSLTNGLVRGATCVCAIAAMHIGWHIVARAAPKAILGSGSAPACRDLPTYAHALRR